MSTLDSGNNSQESTVNQSEALQVETRQVPEVEVLDRAIGRVVIGAIYLTLCAGAAALNLVDRLKDRYYLQN